MITSPVFPSAIYALIYTISFLCWIAFEAWVFLREGRARRDRSRDRGSASLVLLLLSLGIALGFNLPRLAPGYNMQAFFPAFFALGIALIFGGLLFRFWAIRTLGRFFRTRIVIQEQHQLITSGPYRRLRNPSYTAVLMVLLGLGFGIGNWLSVLVFFAAGVIAYATRIALVEEPALMQRFGQEYQDYKKRSWALIPFVW